MQSSEVRLTEQSVADYIEAFKGLLVLGHWRVCAQFVPHSKLKQSYMRIRPNRDRHMATIYIQESLKGTPIREWGPMLIHELLHLVLDPLVEEHDTQIAYTCNPDRADESEVRFRRHLERTVEQLAVAIFPLLRFNPDPVYSSLSASDTGLTNAVSN